MLSNKIGFPYLGEPIDDLANRIWFQKLEWKVQHIVQKLTCRTREAAKDPLVTA